MKQIKSNKTKETEKDRVFIIMPYGEWFDTYYEDIYRKSIEKAKLKPHRLDDSNLPVVLVQEMFENTRDAKIILADLTGNNANVCYELGLAHALNKPTILITDSIDNIPFDLSAFRVILYDKNVPDWGERLKQKLTQAFEEVIANPQKFLPSRLLATEVADENQSGSALNTYELARLQRLREIHNIDSHLHHERITPSHLRSIIGPGEASILLDHYIKLGKTNNYITSKLVTLGAPRSWVKSQLTRKKMTIPKKK